MDLIWNILRAYATILESVIVQVSKIRVFSRETVRDMYIFKYNSVTDSQKQITVTLFNQLLLYQYSKSYIALTNDF